MKFNLDVKGLSFGSTSIHDVHFAVTANNLKDFVINLNKQLSLKGIDLVLSVRYK